MLSRKNIDAVNRAGALLLKENLFFVLKSLEIENELGTSFMLFKRFGISNVYRYLKKIYYLVK